MFKEKTIYLHSKSRKQFPGDRYPFLLEENILLEENSKAI